MAPTKGVHNVRRRKPRIRRTGSPRSGTRGAAQLPGARTTLKASYNRSCTISCEKGTVQLTAAGKTRPTAPEAIEDAEHENSDRRLLDSDLAIDGSRDRENTSDRPGILRARA